MRLALFQKAGSADVLPGLMVQGSVVSVADLVSRGSTPQLTMMGIIDDFERLHPPAPESLAAESRALSASQGAAG